MHEVTQTLALMEYIVSFFRDMSKGQWLTKAVLRYVPSAKEKAIARIEKHVAECVLMYENLDERTEGLTVDQWMKFKALELELRFRLNKLFWGRINEDRSVLDPDHWKRLNVIAIIALDLIIRIREEYNGQC